MRLAASTDGRNIGKPVIIATPKNFDEAVRQFQKIGAQLAGAKKIKAIAGGIAGPLDAKKTKLVNAPNLPDWNNKPLKKDLEKLFKTSVRLENDAAVFGLAEAKRGAGKGKKIVVYITVSTGVGGTRIVNGEIDANSKGFEPGHQIINIDGELCRDCPQPSYLENCVSGGSLIKRFNKKPSEITDPKVWNELALWLAYGLNNTLVHWSPDILILGGPMILGEPAIPIEKVNEHLKKILTIFPKPPPIKPAKLGDIGGLYGGLELLKN